MSETPSARRRKGRNAFEPGYDPMDLQPYSKDSWYYDFHLRDWLDGWKEAEDAYNASQKESEETEICPYCGQEIN